MNPQTKLAIAALAVVVGLGLWTCQPAAADEGPLVGAWTETSPSGAALPPMPTPRFNVAAVVAFDHLVVIGGQTGPDNETIVGTVEAYRTESSGQNPKNIWVGDTSTGGIHVPMPAPRAGATATVIPDPYTTKRYIAVIGGIGPDVFDEDADTDTAEIIPSKAVQIYDFAARTWDTSNALKRVPGWGAAIVSVPERFTDLSSPTGEWNSGEAFTDSNANGTFDTFIHLLNGVCSVSPEGCGFPDNNAYEIYYPGRPDNPSVAGDQSLPDAWTDAALSSPPPERLASAVLVSELPLLAGNASPRHIYKLGGGTGGVVATPNATRLDVDTPGSVWEDLPTMPDSRVGHIALALRGQNELGDPVMYPAVFGGSPNLTEVTDTIYLYQPDANPPGWILDSTINVDGFSRPRGGGFAIGVAGGSVYITAGVNQVGVDGTLIRAPLLTANTPPPPCVEDSIIGEWVNIQADIPTARTRFAYAQIGSKLYTFGGDDGSRSSVWRDSLSDDVEVLDMATNTWTTSDAEKGIKTETPMPVNFSRGGAAVLVNGQGQQRIYVVGGRVDPDKLETIPTAEVDALPQSASLYIYDPVAKTWSQGSPMPTPRQRFGHFVYDNKLHVLGGVPNGPGGTGEGDPAGTPHEVYNPVTDTWSVHPSGTPFGGRSDGAMAVADLGAGGTWAYWFGGSTASTQNAQCARLSLTDAEAQWEPSANVPVDGISGARAIVVSDGGRQIPILAGGHFGPVACGYDRVFHYFHEAGPVCGAENVWVKDTSMFVEGEGAVVRGTFGMGLYQGAIYVVGGDASACDLVIRTLRAPVLSSTVTDVATIGAARALSPGSAVNVTAEKVVTKVIEGGFFAQDQDRAAGIRVVSDVIPSPNTLVTFSGRLLIDPNTTELYIDASTGAVSAPGTPFTPEPLQVINRSVAGGNATGGAGLPNDGLLATTWGKVTALDFNFPFTVYVDDGSGVPNDTPVGTIPGQVPGVKVSPLGAASFNEGEYLTVTGIVRLEKVGENVIRKIEPRDDSDVVLKSP